MSDLPTFKAILEKRFGHVTVTTKRSELYPKDWKQRVSVIPFVPRRAGNGR